MGAPLKNGKGLLSGFYFRFIRFAGLIVPRRLRGDWRREWEAELSNREALLADWDKLNSRNRLDLLQRSLGAFWDALCLQPRRLEDEMFQDVRYGIRMLLKKPGFTLVAALTLSLGIGASTAIFSAVKPVLIDTLPYPEPGRLNMIWDHGPDGAHQEVTFGTYRELADRNHSFESLAVIRSWQPTLTGAEEPERLEGQRVSASFFKVLGASPSLGQDFDASDDRVNGPRVAILGAGLWQRRFGANSSIVGQQIKLDDIGYTVIGVMPNGFENVLTPSAEVWTLLQYDQSLPTFQSREWGHHLRMVGRLSKGIGRDQAGKELGGIAADSVPEFPRPAWASLSHGLILISLQDEITGAVKPALLAVLGAVLLLLIIACVNVANLLLARGAQRRGEFAIRTALGAARTRMLRQLLTESLLLALLGGAAGMIVASFGVEALVALSPPGLPRINAIRIDGAVFAFGLGVTTLIGLVVGVIPALHASRTNLQTALQQNSLRSAGGHQLTRRVLVVVEVALALVLLVSAGLLFRSLERLFAISPGFDSSNVLTMQVQTSGRRFDDATTHRFFAQALEAAGRVPGVSAAAFTSQLPLSGELDEYGVHFEGDEPNDRFPAFRYAVTPGYFETLGIPLRRGRLLDANDLANAPFAVLISESLAKHKFGDQDPIGRRVQLGQADGIVHTIVGVVGDVKQASLAAPRSDAFYITPEQWRFTDSALSLVVRGGGDVASLAPAIRTAIWSVDKDRPITRVITMDGLLAATAAERRFALILFEVFGLASLTLAAIGIYGVLSGGVSERKREIGVRLALGAQRRDVVGLILRQGALLTLVGVGLGLITASAVTRLLTRL
ncbi:MAG TPA: ABC transporter permease, partial [Blastocatellia bacterium]|nr:ABC transporter permease [Blastocatellia bacterium]